MKILVADDHPFFLDAISVQLQRSFPDLDLSQCTDLDSVLSSARNSAEISLILVDFDMPGMNGIEGIARLRETVPEAVPIVVMSGVAAPADVRDAITAGAKGFVPKTLRPAAFVSALTVVMEGGSYVPTEYLAVDQAAKTPGSTPEPGAANLTRREREVLQYLTQGRSNKQIARELDIREVTVKLHARHIYEKLGVSNRAQAAAFAVQMGLVRSP